MTLTPALIRLHCFALLGLLATCGQSSTSVSSLGTASSGGAAATGTGSTSSGSTGAGSSATAGTLAFSTANYVVTEGTTSVRLTVTRSVGTAGAVSVHYATTNGTASAGKNYQTVSGTLAWAAGDATAKSI